MNTKFWGPPGWKFLHTLTFNYPINPSEKQKKLYKTYFELTGDILPCKYCRQSYKKFIKKLPIDDYLNCREDIIKWLYNIHNMVNDKLRKQGNMIPQDPSIKNFCKKYEKHRAKCSDKTKSCAITTKPKCKK